MSESLFIPPIFNPWTTSTDRRNVVVDGEIFARGLHPDIAEIQENHLQKQEGNSVIAITSSRALEPVYYKWMIGFTRDRSAFLQIDMKTKEFTNPFDGNQEEIERLLRVTWLTCAVNTECASMSLHPYSANSQEGTKEDFGPIRLAAQQMAYYAPLSIRLSRSIRNLSAREKLAIQAEYDQLPR